MCGFGAWSWKSCRAGLSFASACVYVTEYPAAAVCLSERRPPLLVLLLWRQTSHAAALSHLRESGGTGTVSELPS